MGSRGSSSIAAWRELEAPSSLSSSHRRGRGHSPLPKKRDIELDRTITILRTNEESFGKFN